MVIALAGILILGVFGWLSFGPKPAPPAPPQLTQEAKAYLTQLALSNVHMQAAESYVQSRLVEILGDVTNKGNRGVRIVQVNCIFRDYSGQPIAREQAFVVRKSTLQAGKTMPFRLAFDNIPENWNQAMPSLVIAQIQFE